MDPNNVAALLILLLIAILFFLSYLYFQKHREAKRLAADLTALRERFATVLDIEAEAKKVQLKYKAFVDNLNAEGRKLQQEIDTLKASYGQKRAYFDSLSAVVSSLEEDLENIDVGIYKPHFEYADSEGYKLALTRIRDEQKQSIKNKDACIAQTEWSVEGSKTEGKKMTDRQVKLMLRAFNSECDAAVSKVKWNNVAKMEERIKRAFDKINEMGAPSHIHLTQAYLDLRLKELWLAYEHQERLQDEREEQRQIREAMREEQRVQRELEKAKRDAEAEEQRYAQALEKARLEVERSTGNERLALEAKLKELEGQLAEAHARAERAISQAQLTKIGHVYVISNVGSFGENVYKIGMTRRLEPLDRIKELGDASVPFSFDVHAMIYSENAPELENKLHKEFHQRRLNLVNQRKEFFSVSLKEIEQKVTASGYEIEFTKLAEAQEYRESQSLRAEYDKTQSKGTEKSDALPLGI